jgi:hypothetical protein
VIRFCQIGRCNAVAEFVVERLVPRGIVRQLLGLDARRQRVWTCAEHQIDSIGRLRMRPSKVFLDPASLDREFDREALAAAREGWR